MTLHDCVMGLSSPGTNISAGVAGDGSGEGVGIGAGMLWTVVPAMSRSVLMAT